MDRTPQILTGGWLLPFDVEFEQSLRRASNLQLLECPFDKKFSKVAKSPPILVGKLLQFTSEVLSYSQADWYFPFAHRRPPAPLLRLYRMASAMTQMVT